MGTPLKLNLGCGYKPQEGFINCDYMDGPGVQAVFDVQKKPWPFDDNSVGVVTSYHMLEHLSDWQTFFEELWRVCAPGANLSFQLPYGPSNDGMAEPGHLKYWLPTSFCALQPSYAEAVGNLQHRDLKMAFDVHFLGCAVNKNLLWLCRWPWKRWGLQLLWYLFSGHYELIVGMHALKTQEQIDDFLRRRPPALGSVVPVTQVAWLHHWNPKEYEEKGRPAELVTLNEGVSVWNKEKK